MPRPARSSSSVTSTTRAPVRRSTPNVRSPICTVRAPSAIVSGTASRRTRRPSASERCASGPAAGSPPTSGRPGASTSIASAAPDSRPPPPIGATIASSGGDVLDQLERGRRLPADHVPVVEGVDQMQAAGRGEFLHDLVAGQRGDAVAQHLGAVTLGRRALERVRIVVHHHRGRQPGLGRGPGDGLRVVAARDRDHAPGTRGQRAHGIRRSPVLERAGALQRLGLQPELAPAGGVERGHVERRRAPRATGDAGARRLEVRAVAHTPRWRSRKAATRGYASSRFARRTMPWPSSS